MRRVLTILPILFAVASPLRADVTITQTITVEGGMGAMMGGASPRMVTRIKGLRARADIEAMDQTVSTITDLTNRTVTILNTQSKTAQVFSAAGAADLQERMPGAMPKVDVNYTETGRSRVIEGTRCEEHTFTVSMDMAEMAGGAEMQPEAAAMMKDMKMVMSGSVWVAHAGPGVDDFIAFQQAAADADLLGALTGMLGGGKNGMDRMLRATSAAPGLPYLSEMTMRFEGSGKMAEMMKLMGPTKVTQRITAVTTDPVPDAAFALPDDYEIVKR